MGEAVNNRNNYIFLFIIFLCVFIYSIVLMVFSREFVIPRMISSISGHITGDPYLYHSIALEKAKEISTIDIGKFEFHPKGQGPAGIASLFYLIWENPYGMVLLNAVLHGISATTMVLILTRWFSFFISVIATLPLVISPYMIVWYSQINKDSFSLVGGLLFAYGLLKLVSPKEKLASSFNSWNALLIMLTGVLLTWIARPYVNQILLPITSLILVLNFIFRVARDGYKWRWIVFSICSALILVCLSMMGRGAASDATLESFGSYVLRPIDSQGDVQDGSKQKSAKVSCLETIDERSWQNAVILPDFINSKLKALMGQRCLQLTWKEKQDNEATRNSYVDSDVYPGGSMEALYYLPRAAFVGVTFPWPNRWLYNFKSHKFSVFYIIAPIEAAMLYVGLASLCFWFIRCRPWSALIPISLCLMVITIYGMATPLMGTLYRYRYPWWILLICLGLATLLESAWRRSTVIRKRFDLLQANP